MVEDCVRIGCTLLFLQVSGRWDAYFPSGVFPAGQFWDSAEGDNFAHALELAHARGIRVHAWVNSLLAWSASEPPRDPDHILRRHPDWFVVGSDGRSIVELSRAELDRRRLEGYYLEPRIPEVRTALRRFVLELVTRYPVDGVHLDYIRWPSAAWGFQRELRERYRGETGVDPRDLYTRSSELERERGAEWLVGARMSWQAWHREGVTELVRLIAADVRAARPGVELSAAVLANPVSARDDFGQDWTAWLDEGILDVAAPMLYRPRAADVLELLQSGARHFPPDARIYAGVSLEFMRPSEVRPLEALMGRYGAEGVAIFSYNLLRENRRALGALSVRG